MKLGIPALLHCGASPSILGEVSTTDLKSLDSAFGASGQYVFANHSSEPASAPIYIGKQLYTIGIVDGKFSISRRLDNGAIDSAFAGGWAKIAPYAGAGTMTLVGQADGRLLLAVTTDHSLVYRVWQ